MRKTYQRALGVGFCISEENLEKIQAAARQAAWRSFVTLVDGRIVAFWCGCSFAGTWICWWTGYDPDYQQFSPGLVASTRMVERLIGEGVTTIDFGGGDATHKERLGNDFRWEESVCVYAPEFKGCAVNCVHGLDAAIGNLFRNKFKRFANRLRTPWRRLLARNMSRGEARAQYGTTPDSKR
jgi:CelD/BcsL family acetyltransferase involved in cellulose biosynthesis